MVFIARTSALTFPRVCSEWIIKNSGSQPFLLVYPLVSMCFIDNLGVILKLMIIWRTLWDFLRTPGGNRWSNNIANHQCSSSTYVDWHKLSKMTSDCFNRVTSWPFFSDPSMKVQIFCEILRIKISPKLSSSQVFGVSSCFIISTKAHWNSTFTSEILLSKLSHSF